MSTHDFCKWVLYTPSLRAKGAPKDKGMAMVRNAQRDPLTQCRVALTLLL